MRWLLPPAAKTKTMKPNLGILLNLGDSFAIYKKSGRDIHWRNNYLKYYPQDFNLPLVFSYKNEPNPFPELIKLLPNRTGLPRFLYAFLIPFTYFKQLKSCQVIRVKQMLGIWPGIIAKILWGIPLVSTYGYNYTYFAKKEGHRLILPFIKLTEFFGLKFSDKIIVTNSAMEQKISRLVTLNKIVLLPNGVNTQLFKPKARPFTKNLHLVSIGRLVYQKNFINLITAVAKLKSDKPIKLSILGRGPLKPKLIEKARELKVNLTIIDSLSYEKIPQFLSKADIFIMSSHHEGSPKALLEAMSCELPCVVNDQDYSRFIISSGKDGLLVTDFQAGLQQLINQPALAKKLALKARHTILNRFNNQTIIKQEISLLKSVIND